MTLRAGILLGGQSRRMGRPKHLLKRAGRTFIEHLAETLRPLVSDIALLGAGEVPESVRDLERIADLPNVQGPLAGIGAALAHDTRPWIMLGCDLPLLNAAAFTWLIGARDPRAFATFPKDHQGIAQPLFAIYEPTCLAPIREQLAQGSWSPRGLRGVHTPTLPPAIEALLVNVNAPQDLQRVGGTF